jgi:hypothetical protein
MVSQPGRRVTVATAQGPRNARAPLYSICSAPEIFARCTRASLKAMNTTLWQPAPEFIVLPIKQRTHSGHKS